MSAYVVTSIDEIPSIDDEGVDWRPIQQYFQLTAFGINVYRAGRGDGGRDRARRREP